MFSFAVLKKLWRTFYPSPQSGTTEISQTVVTSLCVAAVGVCSHWADGAFFFISTRGGAVIHPPISFSSFTFPHLSHSLLSCTLSLLWESTHNALCGNCPIMNTTLLNLNGASGSGQIGRWNIHKALITLLFLADALCALTVGDNHAVPLGCTVYGKSLTIRAVGCNLSLASTLSLYLNLIYRHGGTEIDVARDI